MWLNKHIALYIVVYCLMNIVWYFNEQFDFFSCLNSELGVHLKMEINFPLKCTAAQ